MNHACVLGLIMNLFQILCNVPTVVCMRRGNNHECGIYVQLIVINISIGARFFFGGGWWKFTIAGENIIKVLRWLIFQIHTLFCIFSLVGILKCSFSMLVVTFFTRYDFGSIFPNKILLGGWCFNQYYPGRLRTFDLNLLNWLTCSGLMKKPATMLPMVQYSIFISPNTTTSFIKN